MVSSPTPLDAASANLLISAATSLATEDPAAAQARWDALGGDDELLDAELAKYRAALGALLAWRPRPPPQPPQPARPWAAAPCPAAPRPAPRAQCA